MPTQEIITGSNLKWMRLQPDNSVDSIVTDSPYGIFFMNNKWDYKLPSVRTWKEALRILKPGGYLLNFSSPRTYHRMVTRIEDAGFEIRDCIMWVYGSGYPKSKNLGGEHEGWGTALKPCYEPIVVYRKPFKAGVQQNMETWGTGAINIEDSKIEGKRWPGNFIHDGSAEVVSLFPDEAGAHAPVAKRKGDKSEVVYGRFDHSGDDGKSFYQDGGGAQRFFYCAKVSGEERDNGLGHLDPVLLGMSNGAISNAKKQQSVGKAKVGLNNIRLVRNDHPTIKPVDLMIYLVRLVTPKNGLCVDIYSGSGTTGVACRYLGIEFKGVERVPRFAELSRHRIQNYVMPQNGEKPVVLPNQYRMFE